MFKIYKPFNFHFGVNDIDLSEEEYELIKSIYIPLTERGVPRVERTNVGINEISNAIKNREYISVYYEDRDGGKGHRLLEPYAIGRGYRMGNKVLHNDRYYIRAFVIMDSSKDEQIKTRFTRRKSVSVSDKRNRWRLFRLDGIESMTNMKKKFSKYRRQYNPSDSQMGTIITSLDHNEFPKGENPKINY